jgi:hypothetical protein
MVNLRVLCNKYRRASVPCSVHISLHQIRLLEWACLFNTFYDQYLLPKCQDYGDHWMLIVNCISSRPQEENRGFFFPFSWKDCSSWHKTSPKIFSYVWSFRDSYTERFSPPWNPTFSHYNLVYIIDSFLWSIRTIAIVFQANMITLTQLKWN